jgi:hypothetical protein
MKQSHVEAMKAKAAVDTADRLTAIEEKLDKVLSLLSKKVQKDEMPKADEAEKPKAKVKKEELPAEASTPPVDTAVPPTA